MKLIDDKVKILGLLDKLDLVMRKDPGAIYNNQMKWILIIKRKFKQYKKLTPKQFDVLKNITVQVYSRTRVIKTS